MGSVYVNVMIFVFLYMIFVLAATATKRRIRKERRTQVNYFKEHQKILNKFYLCSFGACVNNFYVLNLIYTYYTPIYKERMKERMKIKINIQYTTTSSEVTYINKKI